MEKVKLLVKYIRWNFDELRGDWSDNRWNCREGWEAIDRLAIELGMIIEKPYRHHDETDENYYKRIEETLRSPREEGEGL